MAVDAFTAAAPGPQSHGGGAPGSGGYRGGHPQRGSDIVAVLLVVGKFSLAFLVIVILRFLVQRIVRGKQGGTDLRPMGEP